MRDGRFPADRLEEVYQRQVLYGGQLDTHLLELGLVDETTLLGYLARASGLPAIGRTEIRAVSRDLLRLFPKKLAERYRAVPLRLEGRALHLACCRPLAQDVIADIGFTLSVQLVLHITSELRLAYALDRLYGVALPARFEHLLAQMGEEAVEVEVSEAVSAWVVDEPARVAAVEPAEGVGPAESAEPADQWQVVAASAIGISVEGVDFDVPARALSDLLTGGSGDANALATLEGTPVARLAARLQAAEAAELSQAEFRRQRVNWRSEDAAAELALAQSRDEIIEVALRFARKRLERVALFVLLGDSLVGWDAIGPEVEARVRRLRFDAGASPGLATVLRTRAPSLGPLAAADPLRSAFGGDPPAVLLLPLSVRDRLLGVLYGDCREQPIAADALAELEFIAPHVSTAFERVILKQKQERWRDVEIPLAIGTLTDDGNDLP
ncbi:MAG: hypothetical protein JXR83_09565 [Deltaproteobacteria bacterium]|nr:hypothetical protein [Deltaproteobacteria bacterium]